MTKRRQLTAAQQRAAARRRFAQARNAEAALRRQLTQVADHVGALVKGFTDRKGNVTDAPGMIAALNRYGELLHPWATSVAARMQSDVSRRDAQAWEQLAKSMGRTLRRDVLQAPVGRMLRDALAEQVHLITSIPRDAAVRVQELTVQALTDSSRADEVRKEILRSGKVSKGKANTIARTETARTASKLTQARAEWIGSEGYIWRTAEDSDVRRDHKRLEGKFIPWNKPPVVDRKTGRRAHAGQDINCRCYPEPIVPDFAVEEEEAA